MPSMHIEYIDDRRDLAPIRAAWNELLEQQLAAPPGMDATAGFEWAEALRESFLADQGWFVLVARDNRGVAGILALYHAFAASPNAKSGAIASLTELYSGRTGFLIRDSNIDVLRSMIGFLSNHTVRWSTWTFTIVNGSLSGDLIRAALDGDWELDVVGDQVSPYVCFAERIDDYVAELTGEHRNEVRRRDRKLAALGSVELVVYDHDEGIGRLWRDVITIERQSWKEKAGTSITANPPQQRFYEALLPKVAQAGNLLSGVLYWNGRPVAHALCIARGGSASLLKTSFVDELKSHGPGIVVIWRHLHAIHERGVRYFDLMGQCEPYKMRWTSSTYERTTFRLFNRNVGGQIERLRRRASALVNRLYS